MQAGIILQGPIWNSRSAQLQAEASSVLTVDCEIIRVLMEVQMESTGADLL